MRPYKAKSKNILEGWFPQTPNIGYVNKEMRPRWRKPARIAFTAFAIVGLCFATYVGVQTYIRYINPRADVTANYFEKTLNATTTNVGDTLEVNVRVYWHGYISPEFKRDVNITDTYNESTFELIGGNNTCQYVGYGGDNHFRYLLKVTGTSGSIELPNPRLYLDRTEIPLYNESQSFEAWMKP
jgi:hypothetical protein